MTDKKKALVGLAEQLIGMADGGGASASAKPANLTEAVTGQVQDLLGLAEGSPASALPPDPGSSEQLEAGNELDATTDQIASDLIRASDSAAEGVGDLIGQDVGALAKDVGDEIEFSSKWDWRREAAERAGG
jgi:hypothetical protein